MSDEPYKGFGIDHLGAAMRDRDEAVDTFIACSHHMENAQLNDPEAGPRVFRRLRAAAVNEALERHLIGLAQAIEQNEALLQDAIRLAETNAHLSALRDEATAAARWLDGVATPPRPSRGPSAGARGNSFCDMKVGSFARLDRTR